ncbi:MAG: T9SS type A sorting domain-containing protein, partial [Calditrichaeota bacterium]|nr:T9SS type A sorting domain-containing protein [Calditrichota bacterium]
EYSLQTVNMDGSIESWGLVVTATPSSDAALITEYALHQNYPNPFNPSTNLVYDVVSDNNVNLTVYNAMGQEVATLVNGLQSAGRHTVSFDASNLTSGLYFYTVKIGNEFTATKKMLLVK